MTLFNKNFYIGPARRVRSIENNTPDFKTTWQLSHSSPNRQSQQQCDDIFDHVSPFLPAEMGRSRLSPCF
jgi:hypothetical protein